MIELDSYSTTKPLDSVLNAMLPFSKRHFRCLSSPYLEGKEPFVSLNGATSALYQLVGAQEGDQFTFTSCGAEAIVQVVYSLYFDHIFSSGKTEILTTSVEEAPLLLALKRLEKVGCSIKCLPVNKEGVLLPETLEKAFSPRTCALVMSASVGLLGTVHPLEVLGKMCKEKDVLVHFDCSDLIGKQPVNFSDMPVDYLTFDGDRFHGPKGSGGVFAKSGASLEPLIPDGVQNLGRRGGTLNQAALVGLGVAAKEALSHLMHMMTEGARLKRRFIDSLVSQSGITLAIHSHLPNVAVLNFAGLDSEYLLYLLSQEGITASIGGGRAQKLNHILAECGHDDTSSLAFSLSRFTTEEEIDRAAGIIADTFMRASRLSNALGDV